MYSRCTLDKLLCSNIHWSIFKTSSYDEIFWLSFFSHINPTFHIYSVYFQLLWITYNTFNSLNVGSLWIYKDDLIFDKTLSLRKTGNILSWTFIYPPMSSTLNRSSDNLRMMTLWPVLAHVPMDICLKKKTSQLTLTCSFIWGARVVLWKILMRW